MSKAQGIVLAGQIMKIATTVDGSWRVTLDIPLDFGAEVLQISALMQEGVRFVVLPYETEDTVLRLDG